MAVPGLTEEKPFGGLGREATIRAGGSAPGLAVEELEPVELIVCGTVAVNRAGVRVGKGGGFSDLEFALGVEHGVIDDDTIVATTVHDIQVLDEDLPETDHDFRVDYVVTPDEIIECPRGRRPP